MSAESLVKDTPPKKYRWLRWLLEVCIIVGIIAGFRWWQHHDLVDGVAPHFSATTLQGQPISLQQYQGKPVLLHFWASWCPMCELEQDSINALQQQKDWQVITIAFQSGNTADVQRYVERENISNWVILVDEDGKLSAQYGIHVVPTTYVLDANGVIRFREVGLTSSWGLRIRLWLTALLYGK